MKATIFSPSLLVFWAWFLTFLVPQYATGCDSDSPNDTTLVDLKEQAQELFSESCVGCHDGADENRIDLVKLSGDISTDEGLGRWVRIFDRVSSGEMPPATEDRPDAKLTEETLGKIQAELKRANLSEQQKNGRVILRRLTRLEYQNTLNDLLLINAPLAERIPAENSSQGFDTVFSEQGFSPLHAQSYLAAADLAIDSAIRLDPQPETKKRRFVMKDSKFIKKNLAPSNRNPIVGRDGNAIVMYSNASYIYKLEEHVPTTGWYKIRAKAWGYNAKKSPAILTLNAGNYSRGFTEMVGYFDVEDDVPKVVEVQVYLDQNQYVFPGVEGLMVDPAGKNIWSVGPKDYRGAGVAVEWIELEGPLYESWPPKSTAELLKGGVVKKLKKNRWDPRQSKHISFEIVQGEDPRKQMIEIIRWIGPRAFRRPLGKGEGLPFVELGMQALEKGRTFDESVRIAIKSLLASPNFLFMTPQPGPLDDFSLASRLSYFLWKSCPDTSLYRVAAKKKLTVERELGIQVERLLNDPKFDRFVEDFSNQWLQLKEIDSTSPDERLYPEFDELLQKSMLAETRSFLKYLIQEDLGVEHLIDSDFVFINRRLAEHYGIPGVAGQQIKKVKLPFDSPRGGLLTQASILKVTANGTTTSPVLRGSWVLSHLLGTPPSPPPPSVGSIEPDTRGATTIRELLEKHRNDETCATCHRKIDPPGFALECFDVIGGYRSRFRNKETGDRETRKLLGRTIWEYKLGLPVDASGQLESGETFNDIHQFKKLLMDQKEQVARNLISQLVIYGTGAKIQFADRDEVEAILERCRPSGFGLRTMIHEVIRSRLFLEK